MRFSYLLAATALPLLIGCSRPLDQTAPVTPDAAEQVCSKCYDELVEHYDDDPDVSMIPEAHRTVLLIWMAIPLIENGGIEYFLEHDIKGDPDFKLTLAAFDRVGCRVATDAFRDFLTLRQRDTSSSNDNEEKEKLNRRFWSVGTTGNCDLVVALARYIQKHEAELKVTTKPDQAKQ